MSGTRPKQWLVPLLYGSSCTEDWYRRLTNDFHHLSGEALVRGVLPLRIGS